MDKQQKIIERAKQYAHDGKLNLSHFRNLNPSLYNQICSFFENMKDFKKSIEPIECYYDKSFKKHNDGDETKVTFATKSLRNILAYEYLNILRKKMTLEDIATEYSMTKQNVQQLYDRLSKLYVDEENSNVYNQETNQKGEI